ncbi:MAG: hypothetical protein ACT4NV_18075, partial [Rhodoferax sp.]
MSKLIACVPIALMVDGQRQEFAAGAELPELSPHDEAELKKTGAIKDLAEEAAAEKAAARDKKKADAAFQRAREDVAAQLAGLDAGQGSKCEARKARATLPTRFPNPPRLGLH